MIEHPPLIEVEDINEMMKEEKLMQKHERDRDDSAAPDDGRGRPSLKALQLDLKETSKEIDPTNSKLSGYNKT